MVEIDRFRDELGSSELTGSPSSLVVTIGGHHRQIGVTMFDLAEQFQSVHTRHVNIREYRNEGGLNFLCEPIQSLLARGGEMRDVLALASFPAKPSPKQIGDIRLVVDDQDTHTHDAASPKIVLCLRGNRTVNSVYSPTRLSTSIVPPCCWVTMS